MNKTHRYLVFGGLLLTITNIHAMHVGESSQLINNNDDNPANCYDTLTECCAKIICFPCFTMITYAQLRDEKEAAHQIILARKKRELAEINQTIPASAPNTMEYDTDESRLTYCGFCYPDALYAMDFKIAYNKRARQLGLKENVAALQQKITSGERDKHSGYDYYMPWNVYRALYVPIASEQQ